VSRTLSLQKTPPGPLEKALVRDEAAAVPGLDAVTASKAAAARGSNASFRHVARTERDPESLVVAKA
jgi:hypothetical protein